MSSTESTTSSSGWLEWLWQGAAMTTYEEELRRAGPKERHALERARLAFEQASLLSSRPRQNRSAPDAELSVELSAESLYFSLLAMRQRTPGADSEASPPEGILDALRQAGVTLPSSDPSTNRALEVLLSDLDRARPYQASEPSEAAQKALRRLAQETLAEADRAGRGKQLIWFQRLARIGLPLALLLIAGVIGLFARIQADFVRQTNVAWRASSTHPDRGCQSPRQGCEQDHFFFHTNNDRSPWIEFDLRDEPTVSKLEIQNRTDCRECSSRAVPLVVEISNDRKEWKQIARRDTDFVTWTPPLEKTAAKWLRLRVAKRTYFHLKQVKIQR